MELKVVSPTTIQCGHIEWFTLDTKLVGKVKALLEENKELKETVCEYEQLIDIQDKREYHKRYLEERRKEQPNLLYPDYDEIYKRYYEQKDKIDKAIVCITKREWVNCEDCVNQVYDILRGEDNENN